MLDWYADVYFAGARAHHWTADQVDGMEVWQLWSALGYALSEAQHAEAFPAPKRKRGKGGRGRGRDTATPIRSGRDLVAERILHAQGLGPKPEPDPPDPRLARLIRGAPGGPRA